MIVKLQQGGGMIPFADYTPMNLPIHDPFQKQPAATTEKKGEEDLGIKDLLNLIKDVKGLPNDSAYLAKQINSLLTRASVLPLSTSDIAAAYAQIFLSIQNAEHHKQEYTNAYNEAKAKGALSEVAITDDGMIAVLDIQSKKITAVPIQKARESNKYRPLTNSDLLNLNSQNSKYTFDISLLDIVENGIGSIKIDEYIRNLMMTLGTSELQQQGYSVQDQNEIVAGLNVIKEHAQGMPLAGLYKNDIIDKNQIKQANKALRYIYNMLPLNAKTLLQYKTGSEEKSIELVQAYVEAQMSNTRDFNTDYVLDLTGKKPGEADTKEQQMNITSPIAFLNRKGYYTNVEINPGTSFAFNATVYKGNITKDNSNLKANASLLDVIGSDFNPILDTDNASFGGIKVNKEQGGLVVIPSSEIQDIELPIQQNPAELGLIAPDIVLAKRMEEADNEIRLYNITDKEEINKIYIQHDLPAKYDEQGNLNTLRYARFARISAIVVDDVFNEGQEVDPTVKEIKDKNRRNGIERTIQKIYTKYNLNAGIFGLGDDVVYEGYMYMPIKDDTINSLIVTKQYPTVPRMDASQLQYQDYERQKVSTYTKAGGLSTHLQ